MAASLHSAPIRRARARWPSAVASTGRPSRWNSPSVAYPVPVTSKRSPSRTKARTVISFLVRVPVLSVQMTVVEPSVSTAGSRRTSARIRAMRCMPIASVIVATAGRPSGTAAMASEMPISSMSRKAWPRRKPATTITAQRASTTTTRAWPSWASFRSRGVSRVPASSIRAPILPISVRARWR